MLPKTLMCHKAEPLQFLFIVIIIAIIFIISLLQGLTATIKHQGLELREKDEKKMESI